jgi:putative ABC transport system permease protein
VAESGNYSTAAARGLPPDVALGTPGGYHDEVTTGTLETERPARKRAGAPQALAALGINVGAALASVRGNWFRSFLTILGVVIGVASVIILVAFGEGAQKEITSQIDTLGTNVAIVMPGKVRGQSNFNPTGGLGISNLSEADAAAVRAVPGVRDIAPLAFLGGGVYYKDQPASICLPIATVPSFPNIRRLKLATGRFFSAAEMDQQVCVLGTGIKKDLFPDEDPLGKEVTVNGHPFKVLGTVSERNLGSGLFGGEELDAIIYLPLTAVQRLEKTRQIHRIFVEVQAGANPEKVVERVRQAMLKRHGKKDDFSILRAKELLSMFFKIFNMLAALLLGITSISLLVGGIGIMNIMLVSVTERTREIGIRKTVGARRRDIFYQFLTEAVTLSILGGILGIALAFGVCRVVVYWTPLKPLITAASVLLGFTVCVLTGIISGVVPAVAASRKDPIEAIRYE